MPWPGPQPDHVRERSWHEDDSRGCPSVPTLVVSYPTDGPVESVAFPLAAGPTRQSLSPRWKEHAHHIWPGQATHVDPSSGMINRYTA